MTMRHRFAAPAIAVPARVAGCPRRRGRLRGPDQAQAAAEQGGHRPGADLVSERATPSATSRPSTCPAMPTTSSPTLTGRRPRPWLSGWRAWNFFTCPRARPVLDVGCGSRVAAVDLAELVGEEGRVHAIDPSAAMVSRTAECAGMRPVKTRSVMSARSISRRTRARAPARNGFSST